MKTASFKEWNEVNTYSTMILLNVANKGKEETINEMVAKFGDTRENVEGIVERALARLGY